MSLLDKEVRFEQAISDLNKILRKKIKISRKVEDSKSKKIYEQEIAVISSWTFELRKFNEDVYKEYEKYIKDYEENI